MLYLQRFGIDFAIALGVVAASEPGLPGSETLVYTASPSLVLSAGFTMSTTLGTGCSEGLLLTDGLTGATGITLFAPADAKSATACRKFGVRSMDGNCILVKAFRPLR